MAQVHMGVGSAVRVFAINERGIARPVNASVVEISGLSKAYNDAVTVPCQIEFDAATPLTNIPVLADCSGQDANKCLEFSVATEGPLDQTCTATLSGTVPSNLATAGDAVWGTMVFPIAIQTDAPDGVEADMAIRLDGFAQNFAAADIEADMSGILAGLDFSGCDGDAREMTVTIVDVLGVDFFAGDESAWTKGLQIQELGDLDGGYHRCDLVQSIRFRLPLAGAEVPGALLDLAGGPVTLNATICDDIDACTPVFSFNGALADPAILDAQDIWLDMNFDAFASEINLAFSEVMNAVTLSSSSVVIEALDPPSGIAARPTILIEPSPDDALDSVIGDDFAIYPLDAYRYQLQDMILEISASVQGSTGNTFALPVLALFRSGCAISDAFYVDSSACWDPNIGVVQEVTPTLLTWNAIDAVAALSFDLTNDQLDYSDSNAVPASPQTVAVSKEVLLDAATGFAVQLDLENVSGFNVASGSADLVGISVDSGMGANYFVGIKAVDPGSGAAQSCVAYLRNAGAISSGSYVACPGSTYSFRLWYMDPGSIYAEYTTDGRTWTDMSTLMNYPGVRSPALGSLGIDGTAYVDLVFNSAVSGTRDNAASLDTFLIQHLQSSTQFSDPLSGMW